MSETTVSVRGQVVIPKDVRERLGLRTGTRLVVNTQGDRIVLTPAPKSAKHRLFGRYRGVDLVADLGVEHKREIARGRRTRASAG